MLEKITLKMLKHYFSYKKFLNFNLFEKQYQNYYAPKIMRRTHVDVIEEKEGRSGYILPRKKINVVKT